MDFKDHSTGDDEVERAGWAVKRVGACCRASVNCWKERRRDLREEVCPGFTGGRVRDGDVFLGCWVDGGEVELPQLGEGSHAS